MVAGEPASDGIAVDTPERTADELAWRRIRYAWLYDDEDIWAAPQP
jgi:hypothetical protein